MDGVATSFYKPTTGLRHAQSLDNVSWNSSAQRKYWPVIDQNCPLHGSHGKCTCASLVNEDDEGIGNHGMGSSNSLHQSGDFVKQNYENDQKNDDFVTSSTKPFNNNPPLPDTQRDIVGNNLHFTSTSQNDNWIDDENDQLAALLLYRDALKRNLTTSTKIGVGLPKMRHGRIGSQWRHIKQTNTYSGSNLMFIDGTVRVDDSLKYPIPRFGYPPLKRPQHKFSSSYNDLSFTSSNPTTKSLDTLTWSATDALRRRPSLSQYSNGFQHHAKDNFSYWPKDSTYQKPFSSHYSTIEKFDITANRPLQEHIRPGLD